MSNSLNAVAAAIQVLVTALVVVEHDREKHIPGVTSGPNSQTFLVPEHVADSLIKAGAVKRADVVDTAALLDQVDTDATGGETSSGMVTTFADVADMVEADKLRAQLAETVSQRDSLIEQLADTQAKLEEAQQLAAAQAATGTTDLAATGTTDPAATGTTDPAATGATDPTANGTTDPAATGTTDPAVTGTKPAAKTSSRKAT